ncbi:MAG: hypothetical protein LUI02_06175 [Clostridiales bacterium]|nr:hypothetical protein [Clostridiales bacterium]
MIGRDGLKALRAELMAAGCDMTGFKRWQRAYEKLQRQFPAARDRYEAALAATQDVQRTAQEMERLIIDGTFSGRDGQKRMAELFHELRRRQGAFYHEFIVSPDDRELSSTYSSILSIGAKALENPDSRLILQSEIENLLELLKENLAKERPDTVRLAAFYSAHSDGELSQLSSTARLQRISDVYESEFVNPIEALMSGKMPQERVQKIMGQIK